MILRLKNNFCFNPKIVTVSFVKSILISAFLIVSLLSKRGISQSATPVSVNIFLPPTIEEIFISFCDLTYSPFPNLNIVEVGLVSTFLTSFGFTVSK